VTLPTSIHLDFQLRQGEFVLDLHEHIQARAVALFGPRGAGKSSVLNAIAGVKTPDCGLIRIGSHLLFDSSIGLNIGRDRRNVAYIPQDFKQIPSPSNVRQFISHPAVDRRRFQQIVHILDLSPHLDIQMEAVPIAARRRIELAHSLMSSPIVLLFDEPLIELDASRRSFLPYFHYIVHEMEIPIIYISHNIYELQALAESVIVLSEGRVTHVGPPDGLSADITAEWRRVMLPGDPQDKTHPVGTLVFARPFTKRSVVTVRDMARRLRRFIHRKRTPSREMP
jgi:molybdate transport system ATP-binding protein